MRKPLQPSKTSRNPEQLRRRLKQRENGWPIVPSETKSKMPFDWTNMANDADAIRDWDNPRGGHKYFSGTGTRIEGDMLVVDVDIADQKIFDKVLARYRKLWPECFKGAIERGSGAVKRAYFMRVSKPCGQSQTRKYTADRALLAEMTKPDLTKEQRKAIRSRLEKHKVEVFGGESRGRYFAFEGPHSPGRGYECIPADRSPTEVRVDELPVFPFEDLHRLIDEADKILDKHLAQVPEIEGKKPGVYFDLEPGQVFITKDGEEIELTALEAMLEPGADHGIYGCMSWESWTLSSSGGHCKAFIGANSHQLMIENWEDSTEHRWKDQPAIESASLHELGEVLGQFDDSERPENPEPEPEPDVPPAQELPQPAPPPKHPIGVALGWMLQSFALTQMGARVVRLYSTVPPFALTLDEFHHIYAPYSIMVQGGRRFASREWKNHRERLTVTTYDMRPDQPFPTFKVADYPYRFKNTYTPVRHHGAGAVDTFLEFIEHLLPDPIERAYFLDWLAHKHQFPGVPGHAVIMVATTDDGEEQAGTGRGTLFKILERLWGHRYVTHIDFNIVTAQSSQGVFNDWLADNLLICVDESREGSGKYGERRSNYEHLKTNIDTGGRWMTVHGKNQPRRPSWIVASYIIASNHADALMLPRSDRRFSVLSNGARLDESLARRIYAWMEADGNLAALAAWLRARNVAAFNMTGIPPMTAARERMMDLGQSDVDTAMQQALWAMPGKAFTRDQLLIHMQNLLFDSGSDLTLRESGRAQFAMIMRRVVGLTMPGVRPKQQRRLAIGKDRSRVYARSRSHELLCDAMDAATLRAEVEKNGLRLAEGDGIELPDMP